MTDQPASPRLGIVISMFPELHETFILRELIALERHGVDFQIYSLQYPRDPITIDEAIALSRDKTSYAKLISPTTISAFFKTLVTRPIKTLSAIGKVIFGGRDRPAEVLKNLAVLPLSLHFYDLGKQHGITHWHGHWANIPTTACWYLSHIHGVTWSAAIHGEDIFTKNRFLSKKLDHNAFSVVCSGYFCNHLKTELGLETPDDVHLNYHGLDPRVTERAPSRRFNQRSPGEPLNLLSIGRLVPTKGHDTLINACAQLRKHNVPFKLQIVGSGPIEAELRALITKNQLDDVIELRGGMAFADVLDTLEKADVFCLAPRMIPGQPPDGIPNVIAEAMALRVPVVSTAVSAIPELVEDGVSGVLVPVDDVDAFAQALMRISDDPSFAMNLSNEAAEKVGYRFDQNRNIEELLALFEQYVPGQVVK